MECGGCTGDYASPRINTDEKILCDFRQVRCNILPLEALYRVVLEHIFLFKDASIT
jgi:hypothetical protein